MKKEDISGTARIENDRVQITLSIPVATGPPTDNPIIPIDDSRPRHSADYVSFRWRGRLFTFSPLQRRIVQHLHEAWANGVPFVGQAKLLEVSEACGGSVRDIFRRSPAWESLVCRGIDYGGPVDSFCLVDPDELQMKA